MVSSVGNSGIKFEGWLLKMQLAEKINAKERIE
jgi:hypothetical protein